MSGIDNQAQPQDTMETSEMETTRPRAQSGDGQQQRLLFLFIDGVGMGGPDPQLNPLADGQFSWNQGLFGDAGVSPFVQGPAWRTDNAVVIPLDACLDTPGLPQSATGQTALLTGTNPCLETGRHIHAFPTPTLRSIIEKHSLMKQLKDAGFQASSANAYSEQYFEKVASGGPLRYSATTLSVMAAGLDFRMQKELLAGRALFHDLSNRRLQKYNPEAPLISPEKAAENLLTVCRESDFTLFEYFLTDVHGHRGTREILMERLGELSAFIRYLAGRLDEEQLTLMITSDHGNVEDTAVRTHTRNPVPCIVRTGFEQKRESILDSVWDYREGSITDIAPLIHTILQA